jgi:hypothetical protein
MEPNIRIPHVVADNNEHIGSRLGCILRMGCLIDSTYPKTEEKAKCKTKVFHGSLLVLEGTYWDIVEKVIALNRFKRFRVRGRVRVPRS